MKSFDDHTSMDLFVTIARLATNAGYNDGEAQARGKARYTNDGDARRVDQRLFAVSTNDNESMLDRLIVDAYERGFDLGADDCDECVVEAIDFKDYVKLFVKEGPWNVRHTMIPPRVIGVRPKEGRVVAVDEARWRGSVAVEAGADDQNDGNDTERAGGDDGDKEDA